MWSDATAAPEKRTDLTPLCRGQVWLADTESARGQCVVVIAADAGDGGAAIVAPVAHGLTPGRGRIPLHPTTGVGDRAFAHVSRLCALHPGDLVALIATLPDDRLLEIDAALREVLGLRAVEPAVGAPVDATLSTEARSDDDREQPSVPALASPLPVATPLPTTTPPATTTQPALTAAPPRLPSPLLSAPQQLQRWEPATEATRLEDHPMARLFGQTPPAVPAAAPDVPPRARGSVPAAPPGRDPPHTAAALDRAAPPAAPPAAADRSADVLPDLLDVVRRRLHRSSPHLEGLIVDALHQARSVEGAAAAVRRASVRGVMQSTLDDIAAEMEAVGARGQAAV